MSDIEDNISETSDTSRIPEAEAPEPPKKGKDKGKGGKIQTSDDEQHGDENQGRSGDDSVMNSQQNGMHQPMMDDNESQLSTRMGH